MYLESNKAVKARAKNNDKQEKIIKLLNIGVEE